MENKVNKTSIPVDAAEPITGIIAEGISERWPATDERIEINESSKEETGQTAMMPMIFGVAGGVVSPFSPAVDISEFSGSLAIKIPIEVPPGRLNMAPRLFLTYDNYHANGWIGVGWVLDMGAVRRSTKHGLDYDANDYVAAISGSSSDLVSRNDWGAGYYGARTEGALSKYFLNATTGGWEVTTKDGTIYYYGTTSDSRQDFAGGTKIFKWCLDRVKDANGNYMTIAYTKSQGEIYLDRIDYAGNTNLSPSNYVKFYLEDRADVPCMFGTNYEVKTAKRLKTIEVGAGGVMVRSYSLAYTASVSTLRSLVSVIRVYGNDAVLDASGTVTAGTALTPVTLQCQGNAGGNYSYSISAVGTGAWDAFRVWIGDFNGDGRTDLLSYYAGNLITFFSNGDGTYSSVIWDASPYAWDPSHAWAGDFNGDGLTDLVSVYQGRLITFLSRGDGTYDTVIYDASSLAWDASRIWIGDFNGDGRTDVLSYYANNWITFFSNGDGTYNAVISAVGTGAWDPTRTWIGDFNGDGRTDVLSYYANNWVTFFSNGDGTYNGVINAVGTGAWDPSHAWAGDFNGDGLTDLVSAYQGRLITFFSNGKGSYAFFTYDASSLVWDASRVWIGDFNGDGLTDLLSYYGGNWTTFFSDGDGSYTPVSSAVGTGAWYPPYTWAGDFNGDGRTDLLSYHANNWVTFTPSGPPPDLIFTVTTPLGATTAIAYTPSSAYENTLLPFILQTVSSLTNADGRGAFYTTKYTYSSGFYDPTEREFRGFGYVQAMQMRDAQNYEAQTETWFLQDYTRKGMAEKVLTTSREGHTRRIDHTWTVATVATGVTWPRLDSTQTTITDVGHTPYSYVVAYTYDATYLNVTDEHKTGMTAADEMHTFFAYTAFTGPWIIAKPTDIKVTDAAGNIKSRKWMDYDGTTGNLTTEEVCKSDNPETDGLNRNPTVNPVTTYQYHAEGNVSGVTDPRGNTTSFTYDATKTFVNTATNALGHVTTKTFDPGTGNPLTLIPPHLQGTAYDVSYQYDVFGRITRETRPDGGYTTYQYLNIGNPQTQCTDKMEHITGGASALDHHAYTYFDGLGRTYTQRGTGPDGKTIAVDTIFDVMGRTARKSNPYFLNIDTPVYTQFTYDGLSRVTVTTFPDTGQATTSYRGLVKQVQDQRQHTTIYTYDVYQRLKTTQDPYGTITQYTYNTLGKLIQVIAASGQTEENTTTMTYDSLSEKRTMTDPDMGCWTYAYDKAGNLISQTDAKSQTIAFTYDAINRLTQKVYSAYTVTNTYDDPAIAYAKGMLTNTLDPSGGETKESRVLALDVMQRITQSRKTIGANSLTIARAYDTAGRTITMTYPSGSYTYAYDAAGNVISVMDNTSGTNHIEYSNYTALGQPGFALSPKPNDISVKTAYTYDANMGRLSALVTQKLASGTPVATYQNLAYQYDLKGNITTLTDTGNGITHAYTYDNLNRLLSATGTGQSPYSQTYSYDRIGNITAKSDVGNYAYTYGSKPHAVRTAGSISLQYDANGNMTQRSAVGVTLDLAWNENNKPSLIKRNGTDYVRLTYDGNGERVRKENLSTGAITRYYGEVYEERGAIGVIHLFANNHRIVSIRSDGYLQYDHGNHLGSASVITDAYGNRKETIEYFPFGAYRDRQDYDPNFPSVNYTFTDQEDDDETGFYNFKARLYDPLLGRFISADSIVPQPGNLQAFNRYSYCVNNPLVYVDPSGHWFGIDDLMAAVVGAVVGGISAAINGGNILQGAAIGAAAGWVGWNTFGAATGALENVITNSLGYCSAGTIAASQLGGAVAAGITGGMVAGGMGAAFNGGYIGQGMLTGAKYGAITGAIFGTMRVGWNYMRDWTNASSFEQWGTLTEPQKAEYIERRWPVGPEYDCTGSPHTAGVRLGSSDSLLDFLKMNREGEQYTQFMWMSFERDGMMGRAFNMVSKVHDFFNGFSYERGTYPGYGAFIDTAFDVYSFAGMPPAAAFTALAVGGPCMQGGVYYVVGGGFRNEKR